MGIQERLAVITTTNGISMYYEIHGSGEPIICISGFGVDHSIWTGILDYFTPEYQVVLFDNRGSGQTDVPAGPYSLHQMADDVVGLCAHLQIKRAHFIGNSMGGAILQILAYKHPQLVKSATLSNTTTHANSVFHVYLAAQLELLKAQAPLAALVKASCAWVYSYQFLSQPAVVDKLVEQGSTYPFPFTVTGYEGQYASLDGFDSRSWLGQIKVPTLLLGADQDLIFSEQSMLAMSKRIPHAQYYSFTQCGHLPFIEYPQEFSTQVIQFIKSA